MQIGHDLTSINQKFKFLDPFEFQKCKCLSVENKCLFTRHFVPYQLLSFGDFIFHLFEDQNVQYLANFQARSSRYCVQGKLNLICLVVYAKTSIICMGSNVASQRHRACVIYI